MIISESNIEDLYLEGFLEEGNDSCDLIQNQAWCLKKYLVYKFIDGKSECTVNEIHEATRIIENTIYKFMKIGHEKGHVKKDYTKGYLKEKKAHFVVVAQPILKRILREYEKMVLTFSERVLNPAKNLT